MKTSLITVAIPYHRNIAYLKEAIDSVAKQTIEPAQLIIIDNSAEGEAKNVLNDFPGNITYVRMPPGLGLAAYFNRCLDETKTPWCNILHSDDRLLPDYVKTISSIALRYPAAAGLFCRTMVIDRQGNRTFSFKDWAKWFFWPDTVPELQVKGETGLAALLRANFIMCPTMCYHLPVLKERRFDPAWNVMLDLDFHGRLLLEEELLVGVTQTLYAYRRHPSATTSLYEKNLAMFEEGRHCIQSLADRARSKGWERAALVGNRKIIYRLYVLSRLLCGSRPNTLRMSLHFLRRR